jgi:hypothetical protein
LRPKWVPAIVSVAILLTAGPAEARNVSVLLVTGEQRPDVRARGAVGLYVPGRGLFVSREEALADLGPLPPETPCAPLQRCRYELFVSVPPLGSQRNTRRYEVTILGPGYERAVLESESTRIPGLVSIDDIRKTVEALEEGRDPPIEARRSKHPVADVERLDRRLDDARRAQTSATAALALVLIALAAAALFTRSARLARAALLFPLLAITLALVVSALEQVGPVATTLAVVAAAPLAVLVAPSIRFARSVAVFVAAFGLLLAFCPETNALMAIGPHPWSGGRFYGITNQIETLLLAPTLAAASLLRGWRFVVLAVLALVVVGASGMGADGGGILVFAACFVALWLFQRGRRLSLAWVFVVVAIGLAVVAFDALSGGSSHVVDAVSGGPRGLIDDFGRRLDRSQSIVTSSVWQFAVFAASLAVLAWFGAQRPRFAVVDAFLVAILVSLVVNDSPTKVVGFGAVLCGALRAWCVSARSEVGIESAP